MPTVEVPRTCSLLTRKERKNGRQPQGGTLELTSRTRLSKRGARPAHMCDKLGAMLRVHLRHFGEWPMAQQAIKAAEAVMQETETETGSLMPSTRLKSPRMPHGRSHSPRSMQSNHSRKTFDPTAVPESCSARDGNGAHQPSARSSCVVAQRGDASQGRCTEGAAESFRCRRRGQPMATARAQPALQAQQP